MNKILVLGFVCLLIVSIVGCYVYFNLPEQELIFETIKPQIICYGGLC